jgi:hypothetical protein
MNDTTYALATVSPRVYTVLHGSQLSLFAILVSSVSPGGLGSCDHSKTQKPPSQAAFVFLAFPIAKYA